MGSLVTLGLARLELDWGKNYFFHNHSGLFVPADIKEVPYWYADGVVEHAPGFARPLRSVVRRLEMLGYTLPDCRARFDDAIATHPDYYDPPPLSYNEFADLLRRISTTDITLPKDGDYDLGEYVKDAVMSDQQFVQLQPRLARLSKNNGTFFENLDPYVALRLLAENPSNLDTDVVWRTHDIIEGGYATEEEIYEGVPSDSVCLIVTEGSSDTAILRESLPRVAPDLVDFFDFIDMSDNYPFTGTGSLVNFAKGLARIRIQNRIMIVIDNDTAGREAFDQISSLTLPPRMRVAMLPDLSECEKFATLGPSGARTEDINGRAVSIELFLDLATAGTDVAVRWTGYNQKLSQYQGELLNKQQHVKTFLAACKRRQDYDYTKLTKLWESLIAACTQPVSRP